MHAPTEIRLYVSSDRGRHWHNHSRVQPTERNFHFRTQQDGHYWFAIRSVDRQGREIPQKPYSAKLRVIVDTKPPVIELSASRGPAGEVTVRWKVTDENLVAKTLKITYRGNSTEPWQPLAIDQRHVDSDQATWWPRENSKKIFIRAEVTDRAGNPANAHTEVQLISAPPQRTRSGPVGSAPSSPFERYAPTSPVERQSGPSKRYPPSTVDRHSQPSGPPEKFSRTLPNEGFTRAPKADGSTVWQPNYSTDVPLGQNPAKRNSPIPEVTDPYESYSGDFNTRTPWTPPAVAEATRERTGHGSSFEANPFDSGNAAGPLSSSGAAADVRSDSGPPPAGSPISSEPSVGGTKEPAVDPRQIAVVKSLDFELDYNENLAGPVGIRKVELWGTRDGGHTWSHYGIDRDRKGPIAVRVESPGVYGFRISVLDNEGHGGMPPRSGDAPEVWISVELDK